MKSIKKIGFAAVVALFALVACNKTEELAVNEIEGTYVGTITETAVKSVTLGNNSMYDATAEVTKSGRNQVQVHFWGGGMDTTLMLDYFDNHDSVMVCLNDTDYEAMYGHGHMGSGMGGGMMGNQSGNGTQWDNHMNENHHYGDEHFGGFDMMGQSFGYTFKMPSGNMTFQGTKQ